MENIKIIDKFPCGVVEIPPSKSLSHRAIICAALANGMSVLENMGESEDIAATLACVSALGAKYVLSDKRLEINGIDFQNIPEERTLDCGESGSTLRFLLPVAALFSGKTHFVGRGRLMQRPLTPYFENFSRSGIAFRQNDDKIDIEGLLRPGTFSLPGDVSSQFVSGLLFALPLLDGESEIVMDSALESKGYVDLTIDMLNKFGILIKNEDYKRFIIPGGQKYRPGKAYIEGDFSQGAFFLGAGALGADVACRGLDMESLQGDREIINILLRMGAKVDRDAKGDITVRAEKLSAVTVDVSEIPDLVPPIAALCCFCEGESRIINAARLRIKESDRLSAVTDALSALGADITEGEDFLVIHGMKSLRGGRADSYNDHRIAMCVALASIRSTDPVELTGYGAVAKSYPKFWDDFERC